MAATRTVKTVLFAREDKYRKEVMVQRLVARNMMSTGAQRYVLRGQPYTISSSTTSSS